MLDVDIILGVEQAWAFCHGFLVFQLVPASVRFSILSVKCHVSLSCRWAGFQGTDQLDSPRSLFLCVV